ncbi:hypothetical protein B566_EDAN009623 [Ephemera danica]|nr:hypothetical protein B566_EDAN009623 [Ephemera danica]
MFLVLLLLPIALSSALKYEAPNSCAWHDEGGARVAVTCHVRSLDVLSSLPVEGTTKIRVDCEDEREHELDLARLVHLEELDVELCRITKLHDASFKKEIKRIAVRNWSRKLQLGPLVGLKELQHLDVAFNQLDELPKGVFCSLTGLNSLNLSHNALNELDPAIFGAAEDEECDVDVVTLDVSSNQLVDLPTFLSPARRRLQTLLVQGNRLTALRASSLAGLAGLRVVNASENRLVDLPAVPLRESCRELREVHLRDNTLHSLGDTFARLEQLLVLDVARNQLVSLPAEALAGLIRLIVLDLAGNALTRIEPKAFKDLYSLQILDLRDNAIASVSDDAFLPLYNLHTLNLAGNRLTSVGPSMLNGLFVLSKLTLSLNLIGEVDPRAFRNCSDLKELDLSGNVLTEVPAALSELPFLRTLDLGENRIAGFRNGSFRNLGQLTGLRLIDNNIGNVLNLAKNKIQHVERGSFERNERLEAIRLDANYLTDVNGVFTALPALVWLNLSDNHLVWFDYAFVPPSLQWLDIHANFVEKLGNYYEIVDGFHLRTIDVSQNRLTELTPLSLPNSVEIFFASNNRVRVLAPATFSCFESAFKKRNLTRVDLYGNDLHHVDLASLTVQGRDELPEFFLGGNPFSCDCTMEWLRNHSAVMDLDDVTCDVESARAFLCRYETRCAPSCTCCANSSCQCNRKCPTNCTCYRDESWDLNVVDCASSGHVGLPRNIPPDATELHLDGNRIREVKRLERTSLLVLYLNRSRIETIQNGAFIALDTLELLYLQENNLEVLYGHEFEGLGFMRELYLQNNRLVHVNNATFAPLYTLQLLRLDGNLLASFALWQMLVQNPDLNELFLANNPWACRCRFSTSLRRWIRNSSGHVMGAEQCLNSFVDTDVCEFESDEVVPDVHNYVVAIIATSLLLLLLLLVLVIRQRDELRLWLFSRYNVRLFCSTVPEDKDKLYDAYLVYSPKDEEQLVQYLSLGLESGYPRYTLCLHHRDLPQKRNLTRVDLYGNDLHHVDLASLTVQGRDELPEFFLGGNPFSCDCTMEWLRNHSAVMDLDDVTCDVESARAFLCRYETRCAPSCTCCANSSCQCNRKCPTNCTCYRDESWDLNVVDCASSGHVGLPRNIPPDATELHLDGNRIREVKRLERTSLLVLYLNRSRIETIQNGAFIALDTLELLYLQENNLEVLYGHEFEGLGFMRELYLQNNRLVHVNNATFAPLYTLQLLRLDGNLLASFALWQMLVQNPDLNELFLANNPWACRCRFSTSLRRWIRNSSGHVMGAEQCLNSFVDTDVCEFESDEVVPDVHNYVVAIIATSLLLLLLLLVLVIRQRDELRLWLFSRYNVRLFCSTVPEDKDKLYDAYLVYSPKDEEQLVQYLSLGLESGYPRYTLCLHHRDLPQDPRAVVAAAESSRRVILVVTRSFLQTEWPRRELRTALAEALRAREHRVLVIEEVGGLPPELERDPELRPLMTQRLRWGEKRFWERLRFAMPEARQYRQNLNFTVDANGAGAPAANKPPVVRSPPPVYPIAPPVADSEPVYSSINEEYGTWHPQGRAYLV